MKRRLHGEAIAKRSIRLSEASQRACAYQFHARSAPTATPLHSSELSRRSAASVNVRPGLWLAVSWRYWLARRRRSGHISRLRPCWGKYSMPRPTIDWNAHGSQVHTDLPKAAVRDRQQWVAQRPSSNTHQPTNPRTVINGRSPAKNGRSSSSNARRKATTRETLSAVAERWS